MEEVLQSEHLHHTGLCDLQAAQVDRQQISMELCNHMQSDPNSKMISEVKTKHLMALESPSLVGLQDNRY